jgi:hypothetical protein
LASKEALSLRNRDQAAQGCHRSDEVLEVLRPPDRLCHLLGFCAPQEVTDVYNVDLG